MPRCETIEEWVCHMYLRIAGHTEIPGVQMTFQPGSRNLLVVREGHEGQEGQEGHEGQEGQYKFSESDPVFEGAKGLYQEYFQRLKEVSTVADVAFFLTAFGALGFFIAFCVAAFEYALYGWSLAYWYAFLVCAGGVWASTSWGHLQKDRVASEYADRLWELVNKRGRT